MNEHKTRPGVVSGRRRFDLHSEAMNDAKQIFATTAVGAKYLFFYLPFFVVVAVLGFLAGPFLPSETIKAIQESDGQGTL